MAKKKTPLENLKSMKDARRKSAVSKSERIDIRVSEADKAGIQDAAKKSFCTTSDYLLRLHYLAVGRIDGLPDK